MSFQSMAWAVSQRCQNSGQKLVLLMLANHTNGHTGQCNPSHRILADECSMGVSTLKNHLAALEQIGLIRIIKRQNEGVSLPNQYALNIAPPGQNLAYVGQNLADGGSESGWGVGQNLATETGRYKQEGNREKNLERKRSPAPEKLTADDLQREGVTGHQADAWLAIRQSKKLPLTSGAWATAKEEAAKQGLSPGEMVRECVSRGWASFRADWYAPPSRPGRQAKPPPTDDEVLAEVMRRQRERGLIFDDEGQQGLIE